MPDLPGVSSFLASCARILGDVLERDQPRSNSKFAQRRPNAIAIDSG
jgi:hypothetical protein